jgi:pimeloyl-ACP methyl ester carboxylesterase
VVFLHGGSAHAHWWDFVAPRFTDAYRPFALDLRGHGDSEWSPEGAYSIKDYAGDVGRWIVARGLEKPILIGHSLGAFVALHHAIAHPGDLAGLIMVDGRATFSTSGSRYMRLLGMFPPAEHPTLEAAVEAYRLLPKETTASREVLDHVAYRSYCRNDRGRWIVKFDRATLGGHRPFDLRSRLPDLTCPVLFVRGAHSEVLPSAAARDLAARCRKGQWIEIPDAHHHVLLDRPKALAKGIRRFLDEGLHESARQLD